MVDTVLFGRRSPIFLLAVWLRTFHRSFGTVAWLAALLAAPSGCGLCCRLAGKYTDDTSRYFRTTQVSANAVSASWKDSDKPVDEDPDSGLHIAYLVGSGFGVPLIIDFAVSVAADFIEAPFLLVADGVSKVGDLFSSSERSTPNDGPTHSDAPPPSQEPPRKKQEKGAGKDDPTKTGD